MHTRDCFIEPERAAPALTEAATRFSDRSDTAPERIQDEAAGSYDRALASLIIAIANITSGPASTPPLGQAGRH
jgi:hypothetical protein